MEIANFIVEIIKTLVLLGGAISIFVIGGGYLAREKWKLLSDFWFHTSIILDQMLILSSPAKVGTTEDAYKKYHGLRAEHQNNAADCFNRLELYFSPEIITETKVIFKLIQTLDLTYGFAENKSELYKQFYVQHEKIEKYRNDLLKFIRGELKRWIYWFLK